jgi:carotenoid cleavage dioxygenase-like enzyme
VPRGLAAEASSLHLEMAYGVVSLETSIKRNADMELVKFIHDFTITGAFIAIALLPRLIVALAEAKANVRKQAEERI